MIIDMGEQMELTSIEWNKDSKGSHKLTFIGTEPNPTTLIFNTNTAALRILRTPFEVKDLWLLKVHLGEEEAEGDFLAVPAHWQEIGIFASWKAAKQRLDDLVRDGFNIVNDSEGKAWDIKRWDLEN